jgi:hypothetical protein
MFNRQSHNIFYVYPAASLCLNSLVPCHKVSGLVQIAVLHLQVELARQEVRQLEEKGVKLLQIITNRGEKTKREDRGAAFWCG